MGLTRSGTGCLIAVPVCVVNFDRLARDDMYTIDEVSEMLDSLESVVRAEIESELIFTAHTNVLLISQILQQAEEHRVSVGVDVSKLEDRCVRWMALLSCLVRCLTL